MAVDVAGGEGSPTEKHRSRPCRTASTRSPGSAPVAAFPIERAGHGREPGHGGDRRGRSGAGRVAGRSGTPA